MNRDDGDRDGELVLRASEAVGGVRHKTGIRQNRRARVLVAGALEADGTIFPVHVLNMSATGALVEAEIPLSLGSAVVLVRNTVRSAARVVRVEGSRCGLRFDRRLSTLEVAAAAHPRGRVPRPVI